MRRIERWEWGTLVSLVLGYTLLNALKPLHIDDTADVVESAVIGVPHPDFGEAVVAVVVGKHGMALASTALIDTLKGRIANYKVPKRVFVVEQLPRNTMGKVQKNVLRERYKATFTPARAVDVKPSSERAAATK